MDSSPIAIQRNDEPHIAETVNRRAQSPELKAAVFVPSAVASLGSRCFTAGEPTGPDTRRLAAFGRGVVGFMLRRALGLVSVT